MNPLTKALQTIKNALAKTPDHLTQQDHILADPDQLWDLWENWNDRTGNGQLTDPNTGTTHPITWTHSPTGLPSEAAGRLYVPYPIPHSPHHATLITKNNTLIQGQLTPTKQEPQTDHTQSLIHPQRHHTYHYHLTIAHTHRPQTINTITNPKTENPPERTQEGTR